MSNMIELIGSNRHDEFLASGIIKPGMLLEQTNAAAVNGVFTAKAHASEGGYAERIFAKEDALQGDTIADSYASGALVSAAVVLPGNVVQARIKAGENITIGAQLISDGLGALIALASADSATTVKQVIATAQKAIDLTGSGAVDTLAAVRVL